MELPVLVTDAVWHIGSLQSRDRGERFSSSLEGHCLSVSHCPQAWMSIARLGGRPLWRLEKPGARLLDMLKVCRDKALRAHIESWGLAAGWVAPKTLWKAWQYDSEDEAWVFSLYGTEAEARREVDDEAEGPKGRAVEPVDVLVGTESLAQRVRHGSLRTDDAFDFLAMVWAEETQPQLDGVWWAERYAPESLSAPRGGIFPGMVAGWRAVEVAQDEVRDVLRGKLKPRRVTAVV